MRQAHQSSRDHSKMLPYRFQSHVQTLLLLLIQLITIQRTQQLALVGNHVNGVARGSTSNVNEAISTTISNSYQDGLESPFIVLMSSETISVARLPMILYGNISEIYHLSSEEQELLETESEAHEQSSHSDDDGDDDDDDVVRQQDARSLEEADADLKRKKQHHEHADAREYEQMPHQEATENITTGGISLGKSEWQQIAAGERDREEVWLPQPATQTNMSRKSSRERDDDDGSGERKHSGHPRRRRSSNLSDDDSPASNNSGAKLEANTTSRGPKTLRRFNRALESSSQNVTSARSGEQQLNSALEGTAAGVAGASAEEGDKPSPSGSPRNQHGPSSSSTPRENRVRFSDFDVHMALGYAFAADSAGRIHRFRLPLSGERSFGNHAASLKNNQHDWRIVSGSKSSLLSENDDADAIDAGVRFELTTRQSEERGANDHHQPGRLDSSAAETLSASSNSVQAHGSHENGYEDAQKASGDSNDVNRVSIRGDVGNVTHEQFGSDNRQHPTISGGQNALAAAARESADGPPISVGSRILDQQLAALQRENKLQRSGANPRVIWSRKKRFRAPLTSDSTHPRASSTKQEQPQRQQLANVEGALAASEKENNQMADERTTMSTAAQPRQSDAGRHDGGTAVNHQEQSNVSIEKQRIVMGHHTLRTEIAVDWLNNLLFVLDKCRLLVMDFDGNNELVLIDDFTAANRPVDVKVDPINDFLFWLQVGKFHNTIYKLDLSVLSMPSATQKLVGNALRLRQSLNSNENGSNFDASDLVPLVSHHYAHPIITNLPRSTQIFTIDHKHSRIYVPLVPPSVSTDPAAASSSVDQSKRDDAEIFASTSDITHLNSTDIESSSSDERNCSQNSFPINEGSQILAYNLDGTDVGPFRTVGEKGHLTNMDNMQDLTLDSKNNLLYWLTNYGKDLFEEFKENSTIQPAQHYLNGKSYSKLIYFDNNGYNQPTTHKSRFNVRKIIHILSSSISSNRPTRSDGIDQIDADNIASSLRVRHLDGGTTRFSRNAPYIILGVTCLIVVTVYLVYALIFHQSQTDGNENDQCREGSISVGSSSIGDSHADSHLNGFINSNTISRWIAGPSVRSTDTSTFNRDVSSGNGAYDIESTNYGASNAVDEHYRDSIENGNQLLDVSSRRLANLTEWPTNMHDRSNKLYVPVEVLQDDALSSIRRVSIDQLEIEKKAPLGEGHFGTVLQGKIKCTLHERTCLLDKSHINTIFTGPISPDSLAPPTRSRVLGVSSASSGHGSSSSTSCDFATANSCTEPANEEDYLTPKNQLNSASSDYCAEIPHCSLRDVEYCDARQPTGTSQVSTKLMVAIKKLKDNASAEEKRDFLQEAKLLANFDHPNIVHLIGICLDRGTTLIVMELMLGGDLIRYMQENTPNSMNNFADNLTYDDLLKVCLDIANGCCYLEDMDYIHRDLAARNCLVSSRKREDRVVKLADFGLARDIYKDSYYKKLNDSAMPLKWMAPECLIEQKFTKKSDVWSFGVVMWEVMSYCQDKPYVGVEPFFMKEHLAGGGRLRQPDNCDDNMYRLMNRCWQMRPEDRPTFHECRAMLIEIRNEIRT